MVDALESVVPQYSLQDGGYWWEHPPETWNRNETELWDLLSETEEKLKAAILEILDN